MSIRITDEHRRWMTVALAVRLLYEAHLLMSLAGVQFVMERAYLVNGRVSSRVARGNLFVIGQQPQMIGIQKNTGGRRPLFRNFGG